MSFKTIHRSEADRLFVDALLEKTRSSFHLSTGWFHRQGSFSHAYLIDQAAYALLLMRTHLMEPMLEGQRILDQLLSFQIESGFFPTSPYEYPFIRNKDHNLDLALTLLMIHTHYALLLQGDLKIKLVKGIEKLIEALETIEFGSYKLAKKEIVKRLYQGQKVDEGLFDAFPKGSREKFGVMLDWVIVSASIDPDLKPFLDSIACDDYVAPLLEESYEGLEPKLSFFELGSSYLFHKPLPDLSFLIQASRYKIEGVGSRPAADLKDHEGHLWHFHPNIGVWVSHFEDKGAYPTCHLWKIPLSKGCCIAQPTGYCTMIHPMKEGLMMVIDVKGNEVEKDLFHIYLSRQDLHPPTINGMRSNTWQIGDKVIFQEKQGRMIGFETQVLEGECTAFGHLSLGYREGQQKIGSLLDPGADWVFSLRPIGCHPCKVVLTITLSNGSF